MKKMKRYLIYIFIDISSFAFGQGNNNTVLFSRSQTGGYVQQSFPPSNTANFWIDNNTYDGTSVFQIKEYINGQWKPTRYIDTINYGVSSLPPLYFVYTGQSNATPRGGQTNDPTDTIASDLTTIWDASAGAWERLHTGEAWMNGTSPNRSVWWGLTLAKQAAQKSNRIVKIVYTAAGGLSIDNWLSGGSQYTNLLQRISDSGIPAIDMLVWYQGESDGWDGKNIKDYENDWFEIMDSLRVLTPFDETTKVIAVELNTGSINFTAGHGEDMNQFFRTLAIDNKAWTNIVRNTDTQVISDSSHINADANVLLGKRLWAAYTGILNYPTVSKYKTIVNSVTDSLIDFSATLIVLPNPSINMAFRNVETGWIGNICIPDAGTGVVFPPGKTYCINTNGATIPVDTILSAHTSFASLKGDTLLFSYCPSSFSGTEFSPLTLSPYAWYDASQDAYSNGDNVTTLFDRSGNARNFTGAGGIPNYATNVINGKPAYSFASGNTDYFTRTNTDFSFLHNDTSTIVIIARVGSNPVPNPDSVYSILSSQNTLGSAFSGYSIYYDDRSAFSNNDEINTLIGSAQSGAVVSTTANTPFTPNIFNYLISVSSPTSPTPIDRNIMKVNNGPESQSNTQANTASSDLRQIQIGRVNNTPFHYLTGQIAEILILDYIPNASQRQFIRDYYEMKYNLSINP